MSSVLFFIAAIGVITGAVGVVVLRNPFYSVLALVGHLVSLAVLFLLLLAGWSGAEAVRNEVAHLRGEVLSAQVAAALPVLPAERRAEILREESADVLTIYDAHGGYGHPDHVRTHEATRVAAALRGVARWAA